jgi:hypothetical protein
MLEPVFLEHQKLISKKKERGLGKIAHMRSIRYNRIGKKKTGK